MDCETERHFTATTFIIQNKKVLLLKHKKLKSWLPPGGHIEENELPHEAAFRETLEETGLRIEFFSIDEKFNENKKFLENDSRAKVLPVPWQILLEKIEKNHFHIDLIFLARPVSKSLECKESHEIKWFSEKELGKEREIFPNTKYFALLALKKIQ